MSLHKFARRPSLSLPTNKKMLLGLVLVRAAMSLRHAVTSLTVSHFLETSWQRFRLRKGVDNQNRSRKQNVISPAIPKKRHEYLSLWLVAIRVIVFETRTGTSEISHGSFEQAHMTMLTRFSGPLLLLAK